jgi:hypothetical protein
MLFTFPLFAKAQESKNFFEGGVLLGFNAAQIDGDRLFGFHKVGLNAGVFGGFPIHKKNFYVRFELLYSKKGSRMTNLDINNNQGKNYIATLNYAEIPVLISYRDKDGKTQLGLGISYSRLFSATEQIDFLGTPNAINYFKKRDICYVADISFMANKNIGVGLRYNYSMFYIRHFANYTYNGATLVNPYFGTNQFNNYITIRGIYLF